MTEEQKSIKVDLGCGNNKQSGYIGVDKIKLDCVDVVHDLDTYPYPFENNSVDEIFCSHYIEHVEDLPKFMDEIYRILKSGAKATIIAPYYTSVRSWQDPFHKRAISEMTFLYFNKNWRDQNRLNHYDVKCDFDLTYGYALDPEYVSRAEEHRTFAIKHYWNVVSDIYVTLTKRQ